MRRRNNSQEIDIRKHLKEKIWNPYFSELAEELNYRFGPRQQAAFRLQKLIPSHIAKLTGLHVLTGSYKLYRFYHGSRKTCHRSIRTFPAESARSREELDRWQRRWTRIPEKDRPKNLKDTIHVMDFAMRMMHPNIWALFKILETLPVSTATPERHFSTLKRIFTDQRATMLTERLSDLAICSANSFRGHKINYDEVIDIFLSMKKRKV